MGADCGSRLIKDLGSFARESIEASYPDPQSSALQHSLDTIDMEACCSKGGRVLRALGILNDRNGFVIAHGVDTQRVFAITVFLSLVWEGGIGNLVCGNAGEHRQRQQPLRTSDLCETS